MFSLLTDFGIELLMELPGFAVLGMMTWVFVRWCVKWKAGRVLCGIALLGLSVGLIYGLLRATGMILYPDDNYMSWNFFDSSFRTKGVQLAVPCALELAVVLVAARSSIQKQRDSIDGGISHAFY